MQNQSAAARFNWLFKRNNLMPQAVDDGLEQLQRCLNFDIHIADDIGQIANHLLSGLKLDVIWIPVLDNISQLRDQMTMLAQLSRDLVNQSPQFVLYAEDSADFNLVKQSVNVPAAAHVVWSDLKKKSIREACISGVVVGTYYASPSFIRILQNKAPLFAVDQTRKTHVTYLDQQCPHVLLDRHVQQLCEDIPIRINTCHKSSQLMQWLLRAEYRTDRVCIDLGSLYDYESGMQDMVNALHAIPKFKKPSNVQEILLYGIANEHTPPEWIRAAQKIKGVQGIIASSAGSWDYTSLSKDMQAVAEGEQYLSPLLKPLLTKAKSKCSEARSEYSLTDRQHQILALIKNQGSSNKAIARSLKISESTVKIHIGHMLKILGLRNRTQLATVKLEPTPLPGQSHPWHQFGD